MPLDNPLEWVKLYQQNYMALPVQNEANKYEPIPDFVIPTIFNKSIIVVSVNSFTAKQNWHLGARLSFIINLQSLDIGNTLQIGYQKVLLKQAKLIRINNSNQPYKISVNIPYWLQDIHIKIWEYTGVIDDLTHGFSLQEILQRLERIENKLNNPLLVNNYSTQFDNSNSSIFLGIF